MDNDSSKTSPKSDSSKTNTIVPQNFSIKFSPDTVRITVGDSFISNIPQTVGTYIGINYKLENLTANARFRTQNDGKFILKNTANEGVYIVNATVSFEKTDTTFNNIFTISVVSSIVKNLTYKENQIVLNSRSDFQSDTPYFIGSKPVTFYLSTEPSMPSISIDNTSGKIIIEESVLPGKYTVSIQAKNTKGFVAFNNLLTVSIGGILNIPSGAPLFANDISPIISTNCKRCHPEYEKYHSAYKVASNIYDRVSRPSSDTKKMPQNGSLSLSEINLIKAWIDTGKNP